MTLQDYIKVFRHRWPVIVICALVAGAITWLVTPASADTTKKVGSFTATATVLVGQKPSQDDSNGGSGGANLSRVMLFLTTGDVPKRAAAVVKYEGDPALLASGLTVTPDQAAQAFTVSAKASDGPYAAQVANAFANEIVKYVKEKPRPGAENLTLSVLQPATPIPSADNQGGFVVPPGRGPRTAIATLIGLLVGLGLALVLDRLDSRLRSRSEIQSALRMPIIAEIPRLRRSQRTRAPQAMVEDPLSHYSDGYRAARTALSHTAGQVLAGDYTPRRSASIQPSAPGARLILVTSAHASEGKTTSVANLAASFAETGQRVLVIDADLRSPDVHNAFDVPQGAGISDYLSGPGDDTALDTIIRPTSVPGVRIITAGTSLAQPAALASRMGHLLDQARGLADIVLVDSAPLLEASDVFDILPGVDTLLLVVRAGRLTEPAGNRVAELVGRFQVPVSGVIIVGAMARRADTYGYGYGEDRQSKKKAKRSRKRSQQRRAQAPQTTLPAVPPQQVQPPSYTTSEPSSAAPTPNYAEPQPSYAEPESTYAPPQYAAPEPTYAPPQSGYSDAYDDDFIFGSPEAPERDSEGFDGRESRRDRRTSPSA